ncbi:MAG: hypothetical protein GY841_23580 [FCB group bacterium]|nr:hypothetical protein [FCB group bacterium]
MSGKNAKKNRETEARKQETAEDVVLVIQVNVQRNGQVSVQNFPNNEHAAMRFMIKGMEALNMHFTQLARENKKILELNKLPLLDVAGRVIH